MYRSIQPKYRSVHSIFRFDLMSGFTSQEGALLVFLPHIYNQTQESIKNGMSKEYMELSLNLICKMATPYSTELCVNFYKSVYNLDSIADDKQRGIQLSYLYGEFKVTNTSINA